MEFLKEFLSEETYNKVNEELSGKEVKLVNLKSGDYVSKDKYSALEGTVNDLKAQLSDKDKSYDALLAKVGDDTTLKTEIENLKKTTAQQLADTQKEYEKKLLNAQIKTELVKAKAKDASDIFGQLKLDNIKLENGELSGFKEQLDNIKTNKPYLFDEETDNGKKTTKSGMSHDETDDIADINRLRSSLGLPPIK